MGKELEVGKEHPAPLPTASSTSPDFAKVINQHYLQHVHVYMYRIVLVFYAYSNKHVLNRKTIGEYNS